MKVKSRWRQELRKPNYPTQAKNGLEWATRPCQCINLDKILSSGY
jgi:hypothetical protein